MPTEEDVRRRYRTLAMRLHPDKCSVPRAEEAFKRVSEAYRSHSAQIMGGGGI